MSLSIGLSVTGQHLADEVTQAKHRLHPQAAQAIRGLQRPTDAQQWCRAALRAGLRPADVTDILTALNTIAGLRVHRTARGSWTVLLQRTFFVFQGRMPTPLARRYPANPAGVLRAVVQSELFFFAGVVAVGVLAYGASLPLALIVKVAVLSALSFSVSTYLHELTHVCILASGPAVCLQKGLHVGVLHSPVSPRREVSSALAGPAVGMLSALFICASFSVVVRARWPLLFGAAVGLLHMISLLPLYGDGKALRKVYGI